MNTTSKQSSRNTVATTIKTLAAGALLAASFSMPAWAQEVKQDHSGHVMGQEMKMPHTAQEHREHAEQYQKKAAEYRKEAETHRKMLTDYSKTVARNPKDTLENGYIKKMRLHCERYGKAADALALEAEEMAKFHTMRAKEVEGK
jgi:hypothetical protein